MQTDVEAQNEHPHQTRGLASTQHRMHHLRSIHDVLPILLHDKSDNHQGEDSPPKSPVSLKRTDTRDTRTSIDIRRRGRTNTAKMYAPEHEGSTTGWSPGQEPGIDTSDPTPPYSKKDSIGGDSVSAPHIHNKPCEITVVDYSQNDMKLYNLDNDNLEEFLDRPTEDWQLVRWINVNGLSWDVIRLLGNHKSLHKLAIEDLMNTRSRTKADWYHDHTFIVLALQKLIRLRYDDSSSDESDMEDEKAGWKQRGKEAARKKNNALPRRNYRKKHKGAIMTLLSDYFHPTEHHPDPTKLQSATRLAHASPATSPYAPRPMRTLQKYHAGPNQERTEYMERNATLSTRSLGVAMEQVSIFLTTDNTVISFFEASADDVEIPIIRRLSSPETILRQSCDASMLMQAIVDSIVDLAIPVTIAYQDAIGDLELDVLTDPDISQSTKLYIVTSEIAILRNAMAPVAALITALREHKNDALPVQQIQTPGTAARPQTSRKTSTFMTRTVEISPMTRTYLGDVEDHIILIRDSYDQMRRNADNLVDVVFNTIGAFQNESMKQLTIVTCIFLPLTFLAGYFGMNFVRFNAIHDNSDAFFWECSLPATAAIILFLLRDSISRMFIRWANKVLIARGRKRRQR